MFGMNGWNKEIPGGDSISRAAAIDALDEIRHALWEIDIPSPTVPEYIEHHEQIQSVWKLLDKKQKELYVLPSVQPERNQGHWVGIDDEPCETWECDKCGYIQECFDGEQPNFCPQCGAEMINE